MKKCCVQNREKAAAVASLVIVIAVLLSGCGAKLPPLKTVASVDIQRFMGDWYVIAAIPTSIEKGAHNAVESYRLDTDGTIATTFTFRKGTFDGPLKKYTPRGFIRDTTSNAVWGMRFIWPFKAEYLITYLNDSYTQTIISRNKRDYAWIMARTPAVPEEDYARLVAELAAEGSSALAEHKQIVKRGSDAQDHKFHSLSDSLVRGRSRRCQRHALARRRGCPPGPRPAPCPVA